MEFILLELIPLVNSENENRDILSRLFSGQFGMADAEFHAAFYDLIALRIPYGKTIPFVRYDRVVFPTVWQLETESVLGILIEGLAYMIRLCTDWDHRLAASIPWNILVGCRL
ncbi:hypothetical protein FPZ49_29300 [Paenibacillus cremeus]|uniref:Uncharacterized protein n=1 Tax=Paenibacillus cremeus TaxID=2163881 RepID=A0A559K0A5_9BACL|nr:hypothetical protein FPZ49_29300 [Paenibacillus cremeus]